MLQKQIILTLIIIALFAPGAVAAVTAGTSSGECNKNLSSIVLATFADLNFLNLRPSLGEFYDPESDRVLRCVALTKVQKATVTKDLYIFDPRSNKSGLAVETDGNIKSVEIDVGPRSDRPLGVAISDSSLFLFYPSTGKLIKKIPVGDIEQATVPIIFHAPETPREVFIIERDHIQVIGRETGIIFHDIYLSKIFPQVQYGSAEALRVFDLKKDIVIDKLEPQDTGFISQTIATPSGGVIDIMLNNTQLVLKDAHHGDVLKTFLFKDIRYPLDTDLFR